MKDNVHRRIKDLLEETNDAFESYGGAMNSDYAGFASMRIDEFKDLLGKPDMTAKELRQILRKGDHKHRRNKSEGCWASFIAYYVERNANQDLKGAVTYNLDKVYKEKP